MKEINEISALVCLLLAIALIKNCWLGGGGGGGSENNL